MAGYIGTQAVSVNTTSATISDDLAVGDDATVAGDATVTGVITGSTVEATGDTAAGDNAAMGYTAAEGLILTGQGSTNDVTIKNDADADVIEIPTGTVNVTMAGLVTLPQLAITHDSNADTVTLTRTANDDNNILKFVTGSTSDWIVGERNDSSSDFRFYSYGTSGNVLSIARSNGAVTMAQGLTLADGDLIIGTAGHGINFSATGNQGVSTPNEVLYDYEEGTWTPTLSNGFATNGAPTGYTINKGGYTRIGNAVTAQFEMNADGATAGNTLVQISGLPYTSIAASSSTYGGAFITFGRGFCTVAGVTLHIPNASNVIQFYKPDGSALAGDLSGVDINAQLLVSIQYLTA